MPIVREFICENHEDFGTRGLRPTWIQEGFPVQAIAHDMLEHRLHEVGSPVTAELQAIGAILALRIDNGVFYGGLPNEKILANMLMEMLMDMCRENKPLDYSRPTRPLGLEDDWAEGLIRRALPMAFDMVREEEADLDIVQERLKWVERHQAADIVSWVRKGFRHARRRYRRMDSHYLANDLFNELDKLALTILKYEYVDEGDNVTVCVDPRRGNINVKVNGRLVEELCH